MAKQKTYTDTLRERFNEALETCGECGRAKVSLRMLAPKIGVSHTTLWRFQTGGGLSFEALDKLVAWLDSQGA